MAIQFDPVNKRIILDSSAVTTESIWSAWVNWVATSDNSKWLPALSQVGGDSLGGSLFIPLYFFLLNDWRLRPMEADHTLVITGNIFVFGGGVPIVRTLGSFAVNTNYVVSVQAQAYASGGGSVDTNAIAAAVRDALSVELARIDMNISSRQPAGTVQANIKYVNDIEVRGTGRSGDQWRPV